MEAQDIFWTGVVCFVFFISGLFEGKFRFAFVMFLASFFFWVAYIYKTDPPKNPQDKPALTINNE